MFTQRAFPRCSTIPRITVEGDLTVLNTHREREREREHHNFPTPRKEKEEGRQKEVEGDKRSDGGRER